MAFGSYDESEEQEVDYGDEEDFKVTEEMKRARHDGKEEQTDKNLEEMMGHLEDDD